MKLCLDCPADISHRTPRSRRCESCSKERRRIAQASYQKNRYDNDVEYRETHKKAMRERFQVR